METKKQLSRSDVKTTVVLSYNGSKTFYVVHFLLLLGSVEACVQDILTRSKRRFPDGIPTAFSEAVTAMVTDVFNTYEFEPVIPETVTEEVVTETTEEVTNDTENT